MCPQPVVALNFPLIRGNKFQFCSIWFVLDFFRVVKRVRTTHQEPSVLSCNEASKCICFLGIRFGYAEFLPVSCRMQEYWVLYSVHLLPYEWRKKGGAGFLNKVFIECYKTESSSKLFFGGWERYWNYDIFLSSVTGIAEWTWQGKIRKSGFECWWSH